MGRIFSIKGNFEQCGRPTPDSGFSGKIVVDDKDEFVGYCEELYKSSTSKQNCTRFIAGAFANNDRNGERGMSFYKLSNDIRQAPLMYTMPDIKNCTYGTWGVLDDFYGVFYDLGEAWLEMTEEEYSEEEEKRIKDKFGELNREIKWNNGLLEHLDYCRDSIIQHN